MASLPRECLSSPPRPHPANPHPDRPRSLPTPSPLSQRPPHHHHQRPGTRWLHHPHPLGPSRTNHHRDPHPTTPLSTPAVAKRLWVVRPPTKHPRTPSPKRLYHHRPTHPRYPFVSRYQWAHHPKPTPRRTIHRTNQAPGPPRTPRAPSHPHRGSNRPTNPHPTTRLVGPRNHQYHLCYQSAQSLPEPRHL